MYGNKNSENQGQGQIKYIWLTCALQNKGCKTNTVILQSEKK
jgi:hypothetical protein